MEKDRPNPSRSCAESSHKSGPNSIPDEVWVAAEEPIRQVLNCVYPTIDSEDKRKDIIEHMQMLVRNGVGVELFPYGSVPLKTYLPDGDIDLTALCMSNKETDLPQQILAVLQSEEQNEYAEFQIKDVQCIEAKVKIIKCIVDDIVLDVSFNQLGGLCTLCFFEQIDRFIGKDHLFKRSIMLTKAWFYYESRILGSHHRLISTYALETLVLYILYFFGDSLTTPLAVLFRFLDYFSKFDWHNFCISLDGPVNKYLLPNKVVVNPVKRVTDGLLSENFLKNCLDVFMVPSKGSESANKPNSFMMNLNIFDPLKENNNLGRVVNIANYQRIRSAWTYGASRLGDILKLPENRIGPEIKKFFVNTLQRHKSQFIPDSVLNFGSSSFSEEAVVEEDESSRSEDLVVDEEQIRLWDADLEDEQLTLHFKADLGNNIPIMNDIPVNTIVLDDMLLDFRNEDAFADLEGDYDSYVRSLIYSQCCHGYVLSAAALIQAGRVYSTRKPWEAPPSPPNPNPIQDVFGAQQPPYVFSFTSTPAVGTGYYDERNAVHANWPYFPVMNLAVGIGKNGGPVIPISRLQWTRMISDQADEEAPLESWASGAPAEMNSSSEEGSEQLKQSSQGAGSHPGSPSQLNSQRRLRFGSFGPARDPSSSTVASVVCATSEGRSDFEPQYLVNEEEFPPLSARVSNKHV